MWLVARALLGGGWLEGRAGQKSESAPSTGPAALCREGPPCLLPVIATRSGWGHWGPGRNRQLPTCSGLRNETLQRSGLPDNSCQAPCLSLEISRPDTAPSPCFSSLCRSSQSWPGDEPRGGPREESGGDVHPAEGPRAAHAEKDGVKRECWWGVVPQPPGRVPAAGKAGAAATPCSSRGRGGGVPSLWFGSVANSRGTEPSMSGSGDTAGAVFPTLCQLLARWVRALTVPAFPSSPLPPAERRLSQGDIRGALGSSSTQRAARVYAGTFLQAGPASSYRRCAALGLLSGKAYGTRGTSVRDGRRCLLWNGRVKSQEQRPREQRRITQSWAGAFGSLRPPFTCSPLALTADGQRGGVPTHLRGGGQQPAEPAATALHRPG